MICQLSKVEFAFHLHLISKSWHLCNCYITHHASQNLIRLKHILNCVLCKSFLSHDHISVAVLAVIHLCLLRYFPSTTTNLVDHAGNCYSSLSFISPLFLCFCNPEFQNLLLSVPSVLFCVLLCYLFHPILFKL